ncbi:c-type cytochrome [Candidatus Methylobacter oryzae]|uniref:C-type cytochrome n=1 Tax=Candidatus Methylobacter oryzae TaxID=2497749 RepID=A0ABY3CBE0_9GAMM|nr:c-type cytochrome [Candidatus Methylobacter oryzae]TRW96136.1 c-type cytochrome [Candidatus Methylobacter oryzae]
MAEPVKSRFRKFLPWALGLFAGGIALVLVIAYSGIFNIAASAGHPAWMEWLLTLGKERSVIVNSKSVDVPELDIAGLVPLGAAHFQGGCATCHRMPGQVLNPVYDRMLPPPPDLQTHAPMWTRQQLFWMVRHGIQFTGMPSWSGKDRDDEVWAVVAFLEALPSMTPDDYLKYTRGNSINDSEAKSYPASEVARQGRPKVNHGACSRCHDTDNAAPTSPYVPSLGGQEKAYLQRALREYRSDLRQSGFMEPIAVELDDEHINNLADYYASLKVSVGKTTGGLSPKESDPGRRLAEHGDLSRKIPACLSCHGTDKRSDYPRLAGQSEQYIRQQLQVLQRGIRAKTPYGAIMTAIAKRLTEQQAEAAAAFFASRSSTERIDHEAGEDLQK